MSTWLSGEGILTSASALSHFGVTGLNVQNRQHFFVRLLHATPSLKFDTRSALRTDIDRGTPSKLVS